MILARMIRPGITAWLLIAMLLSATLAMADAAIPSLKAHVNDLTATLSACEVMHLEQKLQAFEKTKGSQIAVLMIPTTQPETIEQYSIRVAEAWQLGRKGIDDGILLLIAKNDRALRIEVGYGLEGRDSGRDSQTHYRGYYDAAFQTGSILQRHRCRNRGHHPSDSRRTVAAS
jgi:uncharacterized membrane protein YgcG